jgi:hypothetical protein
MRSKQSVSNDFPVEIEELSAVADTSNSRGNKSGRLKLERLLYLFCLFAAAYLSYMISAEAVRVSEEINKKNGLFGQVKLRFQTMNSIPKMEQTLEFESHRSVDLFLPQWKTSRFIEGLETLLTIGKMERSWTVLFWMQEEQYNLYPLLSPNGAEVEHEYATFLGRVFQLKAEELLPASGDTAIPAINAFKALNDIGAKDFSRNMQPWMLGVAFPLKEGETQATGAEGIAKQLSEALKPLTTSWRVEPALESNYRKVQSNGLPPEGWGMGIFRLRYGADISPEMIFPNTNE